jgi:phospholipid/cholesterol/gamma-HCH transport system ATP-binding protein
MMNEAPITEISVRGLHKSFADKVILDDVSVDIERGDVVAIVGGSGCGKTVLMEHLIGHLAPDAGQVLVADHSSPRAPLRDLATLDGAMLDRIRVHWAVVFQRNALFSGSVFENIALWLREHRRLADDAIEPLARDALRRVGFDRPDDVLRKDRDELSGGMAKRVAIARAIAMDPTIIFYDEPTTGLDPVHASQIHELIGRTHFETRPDQSIRTTVAITHDKDLLRRLRPRVIMLHGGRVFFDGDFREFEQSRSPIIRPYFDQMPVLQQRMLVD